MTNRNNAANLRPAGRPAEAAQMTYRRRPPNHDASLAARARALGINAAPDSAGLWRVNGVLMTRNALIGNVQRAERGQEAFQAYRATSPEGDRQEASLARLWAAARRINATVTLHPDGLVSLNANAPRTLADVRAGAEREIARGKTATAGGGDWSLAQRALAVLGWRVSRSGSYWKVEGGGSYTTERLERIVAEKGAQAA